MRLAGPILLGFLAGVSAWSHAGCGSRHRPSWVPPPVSDARPADPTPATPPAIVLDRGQILGQGPEEPLAPPGRWVTIHAGRVKLWVPRFLERGGNALLVAEVMDELDHVVPLPHGSGAQRALDPTWMGVDPDPTLPPVLVVIHDPAAFSADTPTGLVAGTWTACVHEGRNWEVIRCAWRKDSAAGYPLLPALAYETYRRLTRSAGS